MIFIGIDSVMNGTVTMENYTYGVEAASFEEAKNIIINQFKNTLQVITNTKEFLSYKVIQPEGQKFTFNVFGIFRNKPLNIYK